jgi:hypothetical protein
MTRQQQLQEEIDDLRAQIRYHDRMDNKQMLELLTFKLQLLEQKAKSKSGHGHKSEFESKKIDFDKLATYLPPRDDPDVTYDESLQTAIIERALNAEIAEHQHKLDEEKHAADQQKMIEFEQRRKEQESQHRKVKKKTAEQLLELLLSGHRDRCNCGCHGRLYLEANTRTSSCQRSRGVDMEDAALLLQQEYSTGKIIRRFLGTSTHDRLVAFAKNEETYPDVISRLLDDQQQARAG